MNAPRIILASVAGLCLLGVSAPLASADDAGRQRQREARPVDKDAQRPAARAQRERQRPQADARPSRPAPGARPNQRPRPDFQGRPLPDNRRPQGEARPGQRPHNKQFKRGQGFKGSHGSDADWNRRRALTQKFDRNNDGKLDAQEREALKQALRQRMHGQQGKPQAQGKPGAQVKQHRHPQRPNGQQAQPRPMRRGMDAAPQARSQRQGRAQFDQGRRFRGGDQAGPQGDLRQAPWQMNRQGRRINPQGQDQAPAPRRLRPEAREHIMENFDADGDGKLSEGEKARIREMVRQAQAR